ncbi:hypothetical protein [uncultured Thomasclavelia sp.]|uniref:hypothetical protein n=1 Tax=uncultured Thomasclavelia sp. TaxID=3025759 RepID=UPI002615C03F|nr:hypothetical protein [uncultured Thomasclavelia sp.]
MKLKQLFCKHDYKLQIEVKVKSGIAFEQRMIMKCSKCGKTKVIDKVDMDIWNNRSRDNFFKT